MPVEGRDLSSRQTQYVVKDLEIGQPINSDECSETADGVARNSKGVTPDLPSFAMASRLGPTPAKAGKGPSACVPLSGLRANPTIC